MSEVISRIEKLLKIEENSSEDSNARLEVIHTKLVEYMQHTKSILHECLLTLADSITEHEEEDEASDEEEEVSEEQSENEEESDE